MTRKAKIFPAGQETAKNIPVTLEIMENYLEPHFAAIQKDADGLRSEVGHQLSDMKRTLQTVLDIVSGIDVQMRDFKVAHYEYNRRLTKVERHLFGEPSY